MIKQKTLYQVVSEWDKETLIQKVIELMIENKTLINSKQTPNRLQIADIVIQSNEPISQLQVEMKKAISSFGVFAKKRAEELSIEAMGYVG